MTSSWNFFNLCLEAPMSSFPVLGDQHQEIYCYSINFRPHFQNIGAPCWAVSHTSFGHIQQISYHRSAAAWILQGHGLSPRSQCSTSFYACSKSLLCFKTFMGGHKGRYHVQNHKPNYCPLLFNGCLFWKHPKLASKQLLWPQDRPRLSRQLQLHLSCLSRTTFTWAASTQITKYVPLHANPWMYFTSQASSDYT